jgi:predicted acylesterase/phospholipase RssA
MLTAELMYIDSGPASTAVLAALSVPTLLPPVDIDGRLCADAGCVDNFGVAEAVRRGARSVMLIDASVGTFGPAPSRLMQTFARANLVIRVHQRSAGLRAARRAGVEVHVLEVAGGRSAARRWLDGTGLGLPQPKNSPTPSQTHSPATSPSRARITATASALQSTSRNRRPSSLAATPVVPLPAHQSSTKAP